MACYAHVAHFVAALCLLKGHLAACSISCNCQGTAKIAFSSLLNSAHIFNPRRITASNVLQARVHSFFHLFQIQLVIGIHKRLRSMSYLPHDI